QHSNIAPNSQAHTFAVASDQTAILGELSQVGATNIHGFHLINAVSATVSPAEASRLSANPAVSEVVPDALIQAPRIVQSDTLDSPASSRGSGRTSGPRLPTPACAPGVTLEPEALQRIRAAYQQPFVPQAQQLATGSGVKVGYIADGIDINNPDFIRADGTHVFAGYQDFTGDGAGVPTGGGEAFLDASSIAAQGRQIYDINSTALFPAPRPCYMRIRGVAPDASLYGYDVFGTTHTTTTSNFVQAIEYAVTVDHVDVLNESFGGNPFPDMALDAIRLADDAAVAAGVTVTVSTGDSSFANTIGSPSSDPNVIAVGASTQFRSYQQTSSSAYQLGNGGYLSDNISSISSGGFTQEGPRTVDLVAPGDSDFAVCTPSPLFTDCVGPNGNPSSFELTGGTSESAPLTAGAVALVIQAYRQTHQGVTPTPALVKSILMSTARDLGYPTNEQGSGLLDSYRAVQAALAYPGGNGAAQGQGRQGGQGGQGDSLVVDNTSFSATDQPNTPETFNFTVTNVGQRSRRITPRLRSLSRTLSSQTFTVNHQPTTAPQFYDEFGTLRAYSEQDFFVRPGAQYLSAAIAWNIAQQPNTLVRLTLFDPFGRFAAYSLPQGLDGYGRVDVQSPFPGQWRAILWTPASSTAYTGAVQLKVDQQAFTTSSIGSGIFTPAIARIGPGQSAAFTMQVTTPAQAGDESEAVELDTGSGEYDPFGNLTSLSGLFGSGLFNAGLFGSGLDWLNVPPVQQSAFGVLPVSLRSEVPLSAAGG
ncbi:MAG: S8 family serine peptidase, partial [Chloroflexota bacterium]